MHEPFVLRREELILDGIATSEIPIGWERLRRKQVILVIDRLLAKSRLYNRLAESLMARKCRVDTFLEENCVTDFSDRLSITFA